MSFASRTEYKLRESSSYSIQFILHGYDTRNSMSAFCPAAMNESGKIKNLTRAELSDSQLTRQERCCIITSFYQWAIVISQEEKS